MAAEKAACGAAHADNVAPSLLGGFVLVRSYQPLDVVKLPVPAGLACAVVHPHTEVRTEDARRILKKEIRLADAIRQWGNLAALVAALYRGDLPLLGRSLQDVVAEPVRSVLIPGFPAVKAAALAAGALGCSISGSGPSVFALCDSLDGATGVAAAMHDAFSAAGLDSDVFVSLVNAKGPVVLARRRAGRAVTFASLAHPDRAVSFREALFSGLAPDGGLYHPLEKPDLSALFSSFDEGTSFPDLAAAVVARLLAPEIDEPGARRIVSRAFTFSPVLRPLDERILLLELFHGPTCAFKDFGAQFLAACMEDFLRGEKKRIQILVATSGDTGSAVAHAFHGRAGIDVIILYPSGRVSELQEKQLTTLGGNVHALEVQGSFDDCQRLAKEAFRDPRLAGALALTSANSINIGRLLPQSLYYIFAATRRAALQRAGSPTICVPSGNFGNLTAGAYAWAWGLPVRGFIAATNVNDVVPAYLRTGSFLPRASTQTLSNAMDVGNPSNFERLEHLFAGDWKAMGRMIRGASVSDQRTLATMREVHERTGLFVDPHTAVGCAAAAEEPGPVIVLSTAHAAKFVDAVKQATGSEPEMPERLARSLALPKSATTIGTGLPELSKILLERFA